MGACTRPGRRQLSAQKTGVVRAEMGIEDGATRAHAAAFTGNVSALASLWEQDPALLRAQTAEGETPAHHAAAAGMAASLECLGDLDHWLLLQVDSEGWCVGEASRSISPCSCSFLCAGPLTASNKHCDHARCRKLAQGACRACLLLRVLLQDACTYCSVLRTP